MDKACVTALRRREPGMGKKIAAQEHGVGAFFLNLHQQFAVPIRATVQIGSKEAIWEFEDWWLRSYQT